MRKNSNKVLTVATLVARNAKQAMVESGGVCVWQESGSSRREGVFTFEKELYKLCTFDTISKDNAAINCITVQHRKGSFPSTLTGHTALVIT
jgi:Tfp pilus assembly ATPase PilU